MSICLVVSQGAKAAGDKLQGQGCGSPFRVCSSRFPGSPPLKYTLRKKAPEGRELRGFTTDAGGEDAASPQTLLRNATQSAGRPGRPAASLPPGSRGAPLTLESPGRAAGERGAPAGRRAGVFGAGRKRGAGSQAAGAAGSGGQERAASPRGGTSAARRDGAAPQPRRIRVPRRRTHLPGAPPPPAPGSECAVSNPGHSDGPAAAPPSPPLSRRPPAPRGATPARRRLPWPTPPLPPPSPHQPTEHARAAAVPASAPQRVPAFQQPSPRPARRSGQSPTFEPGPAGPSRAPREERLNRRLFLSGYLPGRVVAVR
ncbi:collagen alpha-1(I) chain-like [Camelus ferus]|uniref:Collagen alpha-1(I) chain-like n=1 Tax=Camelus ferus TaxID=419612 RepID=A0A8B8TDG9_CAMFR|nr:collagen alpha-1(I) chain-like [Camelus ferus]